MQPNEILLYEYLEKYPPKVVPEEQMRGLRKGFKFMRVPFTFKEETRVRYGICIGTFPKNTQVNVTQIDKRTCKVLIDLGDGHEWFSTQFIFDYLEKVA